MASTVQVLRDWLAQFDATSLVGIDEGGLALRGERGAYFELGGEPACYHDAPSLKSGDRCECGEIKP